jgi:hypothetical protein
VELLLHPAALVSLVAISSLDHLIFLVSLIVVPLADERHTLSPTSGSVWFDLIQPAALDFPNTRKLARL